MSAAMKTRTTPNGFFDIWHVHRDSSEKLFFQGTYLSLPVSTFFNIRFSFCRVYCGGRRWLPSRGMLSPGSLRLFFFLRIGKMLMVCYKGRNNTAGCLFPRLLSPPLHTLRNLVQFDIEIQSTLFLSIRLFALVTLGNDRPGFSRCNPLLCLPRYSLITCHFIPLRKRPESFSMISCRATTCSFICCFLSLEDNNNKKMRFPWKIDVELVFFPFSVVVGFSLFFPRVCAGCRLMEIPRFNWHLMTSLFTRMKGKALWPT